MLEFEKKLPHLYKIQGQEASITFFLPNLRIQTPN